MGHDDREGREEGAPVPLPRNRTHHRTDVSLAVATLAFRQRPMRIAAEQLAPTLQCTLIQRGEIVGRCTVLDVSAAGVGVLMAADTPLWMGMRFDQVKLEQGTKTVADGPAEVVNLVERPERRAGLRFADGEIELSALRLRDGSPLDPGGATEAATALPPDWRAAVAELGQILRWSGFFLNNAIRPRRGSVTPAQEQAIFAEFFAQWGPQCLGSLARLHDLSSTFDESQRAAGCEHARAELLGNVLPSLTLAPEPALIDDYALPLVFTEGSELDDTLSSRFLRYAWARFPLVRTILARPRWLAELWDALRTRPRARALVVQPGGAAELAEVQITGGSRLEVTLVDAAPSDARESGWREHWPGRADDLSVVKWSPPGLPPLDVDDGYDLVYGAGVLGGLSDDDVRVFIRALHERLAPGGRLVLGGLRVEPASTWLLDYVLGRTVHYREVQALGGMVEELDLPCSSWHVNSDPTGRAAMLDLIR